MIRLTKQSKLAPSQVIDKAEAFFGPSGVGLTVVDEADCCARFEGGGGYVFVQAADGEDGASTDVTVEGREWDYQIKQFMGQL